MASGPVPFPSAADSGNDLFGMASGPEARGRPTADDRNPGRPTAPWPWKRCPTCEGWYESTVSTVCADCDTSVRHPAGDHTRNGDQGGTTQQLFVNVLLEDVGRASAEINCVQGFRRVLNGVLDAAGDADNQENALRLQRAIVSLVTTAGQDEVADPKGVQKPARLWVGRCPDPDVPKRTKKKKTKDILTKTRSRSGLCLIAMHRLRCSNQCFYAILNGTTKPNFDCEVETMRRLIDALLLAARESPARHGRRAD